MSNSKQKRVPFREPAADSHGAPPRHLVDIAQSLFGSRHGVELRLPQRGCGIRPPLLEFHMALDLSALRRYIDEGSIDNSRTARLHSAVLKHAAEFERMNGEERKKVAVVLFDKASYATEINKMIALARQLAAEGYALRND